MAAGRELLRQRLIRRVLCPDVRFAAFFAAAGYGKSTLARQLATHFRRTAVCDFADVVDTRDLARRVAVALAPTPEVAAHAALPANAPIEDFVHFAQRLWADSPADFVICENCEHLRRIAGAEAELAALLSSTPPSMRACICSRIALDIPFLRFALPHEVVMLHERDLAFDSAELASFAPFDSHVGKVYELTRGWPLCVRLVARLAESRDIQALMDEIGSLEFSLLHEYLIENVIDAMDPFVRSVFVGLSASALTDADVRRIFLQDRARALDVIESSPFVVRQDSEWVLHPLIRASIQRRYGSEAARMLRIAAERAQPEDRLRAGTLYARLGDYESAACAIEPLAVAFVNEPANADFPAVLQQIPYDVLLNHPRLFCTAMVFAGLSISSEQRLSDGLLVKDRLTESDDSGTRMAVDFTIANALTNLGRHDEALRYVASMRDADDSPSQVYYGFMYGGIQARIGKYRQATEHWEPLKSAAHGARSTLCLAANEILVSAARSRGDFQAEADHVAYSLVQARRAHNPTVYAYTLCEAIFSAWFRGDESTFNTLVAELDALRFPAVMPGTRLFRACASGVLDDLSGDVARPQMHTYAYLIALATARADLQRDIALEAIDAADRANQPFLQCITRVALALIDDSCNRRMLGEAQQFADKVESEALREAVRELEGGRVPQFFRALAQQLGVASQHEGYRLSILEQSLYRGAERLSPSKREFELLAYLAFRDREVSMDELAEAFAPDASSSDAARLIRVVIARIRKRFGNDLVASGSRGYALGTDVEVPLRLVRARVARCEAEKGARNDDRVALQHDLYLIKKYLAGRRLSFEWGEELDRDVEDLAEKITAMIACEPSAQRALS